MSRRRWAVMAVVLLASGECRSAGAEPRGAALEVEPEDVRPGLVAQYRSAADAGATVGTRGSGAAFSVGWRRTAGQHEQRDRGEDAQSFHRQLRSPAARMNAW